MCAAGDGRDQPTRDVRGVERRFLSGCDARARVAGLGRIWIRAAARVDGHGAGGPSRARHRCRRGGVCIEEGTNAPSYDIPFDESISAPALCRVPVEATVFSTPGPVSPSIEKNGSTCEDVITAE